MVGVVKEGQHLLCLHLGHGAKHIRNGLSQPHVSITTQVSKASIQLVEINFTATIIIESQFLQGILTLRMHAFYLLCLIADGLVDASLKQYAQSLCLAVCGCLVQCCAGKCSVVAVEP